MTGRHSESDSDSERTPVRTAIIIVALAVACAMPTRVGRAQRPTRRDADRKGVALRTRGRSAVVVKERGRAHVLDLSQHVEAARVEVARELFMTREGGFVYLLLQVCGPSKAKPDMHQCGEGEECSLVWLKLDETWRERDAKSVRYESCWQPITSDEGPKVEGRRATLEFDDLRDDTTHEVAYDADKPEAGLVEKTRPTPKQNP